MNKDDLTALALEFSTKHRVPVFPCSNDKKPLTRHGFKDASQDPHQIRDWFAKDAACLIGMPTGAMSGISVLDIDKSKIDDQPDGFAWLEENKHLIPDVHTVKSKSGGQHFYFKHVAGTKCSAGKLAPCVDVRADGGYIIVGGNGYEVLQDLPFGLLPPFPQSILNQRSTSPISHPPLTTDGPSLFDIEKHKQPGQWHDWVLRWVAREVAKGTDTEDIVRMSLEFTLRGDNPAKTEKEVRIMIRGAIEKGFSPRANSTFHPLVHPLPLAEKIPALPKECLPPSLAPWLMDIAYRLDLPHEYVAGASLVGASSLIGRHAAIRPKIADDWTEFGNLWGMLIAEPGEMKTPATTLALSPIKDLERRARAKWVSAETKLREKLNEELEREKYLKKKYKDMLGKSESEDLTLVEAALSEVHRKILQLNKKIAMGGERFLCNDATTEKLAEICMANPYGLLVNRDELAGFVASLSKAGREGDREFYLEAWGGDGEHSYDRIGRGTLYVPHLCLSIFGTIQPGKVKALVTPASSAGAGADGFIQRFQILLYPDRTPTKIFRDQSPDAAAKKQYETVFDEIAAQSWAKTTASLEKGFTTAGPDSSPYYVFSFDDEAQKIATEWFIALEEKISAETSPGFKSHIAKYRGLMPRLALNYFLTETSAKAMHCAALPIEAVNSAIAWCEHLESHARKVWAGVIDQSFHPTSSFAERIEKKQITNGMSLRDIQQSKWRDLKDVESVEIAAQKLESLGWIKIVIHKENGGRPSRKIEINPELLLRLTE